MRETCNHAYHQITIYPSLLVKSHTNTASSVGPRSRRILLGMKELARNGGVHLQHFTSGFSFQRLFHAIGYLRMDLKFL